MKKLYINVIILMNVLKLGKKHMIKWKILKTYDKILHLINKTRNDIKVIENVVMNLMWGNLNVYIQALRIAKKACDEY